jgi:hypothetical protein
MLGFFIQFITYSSVYVGCAGKFLVVSVVSACTMRQRNAFVNGTIHKIDSAYLFLFE